LPSVGVGAEYGCSDPVQGRDVPDEEGVITLA